MEDIEREIRSVEDSSAAARVMSDTLQFYDKENKRLWIAVLSMIAAVIIMAGCMVYVAVNGQHMIDAAMWKALNTTGETTITTTEQTVEGDSATINNVDGDQYNDNAQRVAGEN